MIDFQYEKLFSLIEAACLIPPRNGRKVSISTLYRWTTRGCRGVHLEFTQVGSTRMTSSETLTRFFSRLAKADKKPEADAAIETELDAEGI